MNKKTFAQFAELEAYTENIINKPPYELWWERDLWCYPVDDFYRE